MLSCKIVRSAVVYMTRPKYVHVEYLPLLIPISGRRVSPDFGLPRLSFGSSSIIWKEYLAIIVTRQPLAPVIVQVL